MQQSIEDFISYLGNVKKASLNTRQSYRRDLLKMKRFMETNGINDVGRITVTNINAYVLKLEKDGLSAATISRNIAAMRSYFHYLMMNKKIDYEPIEFLKAPPIKKKAPTILSVEEVDRIMRQPSGNSAKEVRDKAMIELLYATGIRVSEMILLKISDVNLEMDYIVCHSDTRKDRIVPFGSEAKKALSKWLDIYRDEILKGKESDLLFLNCQGNQMSRQGFWKIIKGYGAKAGIKEDITPHTIRHSFAAHLVQNGADLKSVQEMMGLSDISSARIYADMSKQKIRDVYANAHPRM